MRFGQCAFISLFMCACLGAAQAVIMAETLKEHSELKLMPMQAVPVERAGQWTPPAERLADIIDEIKDQHGPAYCWALLMREAARVKRDEDNARVRKAEEAATTHEG